MLEALKAAVRPTPLAIPFIKLKRLFTKPYTQNEEDIILKRLLWRFDVPHRFVEFGFGGWEFNCAPLVDSWDGLLLDGDSYNIRIGRAIFPPTIRVEQKWITRESLSIVKEYAAEGELGILSIDVDGNDYWFLEELIETKPAIIIAEYNSVLGFEPITVPYDPEFRYREKHDSHYYWGASLAALTHLTERNGYSLIEVGVTGTNSFFVRNELLGRDDQRLDPRQNFRERNWEDGLRRSQQWERIKHMPFVDVTKTAA